MTTEPCAICRRPVAVSDALPGAAPDKRRAQDGKIRCIGHIGVEKVKPKPSTIKDLARVVEHQNSQVRFDCD